MEPIDEATERRSRWLLLLIPFVIHTVLVILDVVRMGELRLGRIDYAILAGSVIYLFACSVVVRRRLLFYRVISVVYTLIAGLMITGGIGRLIDPPLPAGQWLPHYPGESVLELKDAIPGRLVSAEFTVNQYGLRGPDYKLGQGELKVLCIGGSTTECRAITDHKSWPWQLQGALTEALSRSVLVGNAGRSGHFVPHHAYQAEHYTFVDEFDHIIVLVGINDLGRALHDDYERRIGTVPRDSLLFNEGLTGLYYRRLFVVRKLQAFWNGRKKMAEGVVVENYDAKIASIRAARMEKLTRHAIDELPADFSDSVDRYKMDLRSMITHCKARNQSLIFLTQPTTWAEDMSEVLAGLLCAQVKEGAYTPECLAEGIAHFNNALMEVCDAENVPCFDLAGAMPKTLEMMYDDCHFTEEGCGRAATFIARHFTDWLRSQP